jgi:hypothetical protein
MRTLAGLAILTMSIALAGGQAHSHHRQKSLKRFGASEVETRRTRKLNMPAVTQCGPWIRFTGWPLPA